jgi:hypothetical protein
VKRKQRKRTAVLLQTGCRGEGVYALKALARFLNAKGYRPSPAELAKTTGYRSRWWWWRRLRRLSTLTGSPLVQQRGRGRWELTPYGWQHVGLRLRCYLLEQKARSRARRGAAVKHADDQHRLDKVLAYDMPNRWDSGFENRARLAALRQASKPSGFILESEGRPEIVE